MTFRDLLVPDFVCQTCVSVLSDLWHDHHLPGLLAVVVGGPVDDVEDEEEDGEEDEEEAVHLGVALALPPGHAVLVVVPEGGKGVSVYEVDLNTV